MNTEYVKAQLATEGIRTEEVTIVKNGNLTCRGLRITNAGDGSVCPVVYYDPSECEEDYMDRIRAIAAQEMPVFNTELLKDPAYIYGHVYLAVERRGDGDRILRKHYLNLDLVLRVSITGVDDASGSIRVDSRFMELSGTNEQDLWCYAFRNTAQTLCIRTIAEALGLPNTADFNIPLYVCGTEDPYANGAAILAFPDMFETVLDLSGADECFIIPSSTQEVLALPVTGLQPTVEELLAMVVEINAACVDPVLRLDPAILHYQRGIDMLEIVIDESGKGVIA